MYVIAFFSFYYKMDWKKVISNNAKKVSNANKNTTYPRYPQTGGKKGSGKNMKSYQKGKGQSGGGVSSGEETVEVGSSTLTFMTLICIIGMCFMMGLVIYLLWKNNTMKIQENMNDMPVNGNKVDLNIRIRNDDPEIPNPNLISYPEMVVDKAYERLANPLLPPERSYEMAYGVPINIPSRGYVGSYQQLGHLYKTEVANPDTPIGNNTEPTILPLFGRPLYNGSRKWTYYTSTDKVNMIKLPLTVAGRKCDQDYGCDEIYSGDMIEIPPYNGKFKVEIYDYDKPRYIPYAF
jgi:hypothetical protein